VGSQGKQTGRCRVEGERKSVLEEDVEESRTKKRERDIREELQMCREETRSGCGGRG